MLNAQAILIDAINFARVKRIGIDEIALVKGQGNYLAVIVDLDTNKPIEILRSALRYRVGVKSYVKSLRDGVMPCWSKSMKSVLTFGIRIKN